MKPEQEPGKARLVLGWSAALLAVGVAAWAAFDYAKWRALGPGGLPANFRGWLSMTRFRLMAHDGLEIGPLAAALGTPEDLRSWIEVQPRVGKRPVVSPYPVPHRQLNQLPGEEIRRELTRLFDHTVLQHAADLEYLRSHFEKRHPAITLKHPAGKVGGRSHGEIAHIHPSDYSMHMILSPGDATASIAAGWAQRHGLAGVGFGLPSTYVMVYAPRNEQDLRVVGALLAAAIAYALQLEP